MTVSLSTKPLPGTVADPLYPDSDGLPMGETGFHVAVMIYLRPALQEHFRHRANVYVAADMFFYFEQGNPRANKSPDIMVIFGVESHERRSFRLWEEKRGPAVIIELVSTNTWKDDLGEKRTLYARLGVTEYFVFDPTGECIHPRLQGFRLQEGEDQYRSLFPAPDGSLISQEMSLRLAVDGILLRLFDLRTNQPILTPDEHRMRAEQEHQRAEVERRRADHEKKRAEQEEQHAEAERLRAEQQHHRAEAEHQRAEAERLRAEQQHHRAEAEHQRAEAERLRAEALAAELAHLREKLKQPPTEEP